MNAEQKIMSQNPGKFAIKQMNHIVIPYRTIHGKRIRLPFDTKGQAKAWAEENYQQSNWSVFRIPALSE